MTLVWRFWKGWGKNGEQNSTRGNMHVQEHEDQNECIYFVQQLEVSYAPGTVTGVRDTTIRQSLYLSSSPGKSGCRGMIKVRPNRPDDADRVYCRTVKKEVNRYKGKWLWKILRATGVSILLLWYINYRCLRYTINIYWMKEHSLKCLQIPGLKAIFLLSVFG